MKFFNKSNNKTPERHAENATGDFYAEHGVCTSCGAPQAEAPDLIEHSNIDFGNCYFKKQPQTNDEIERAIQAIAVSCISGLRYGRNDENILKRLYEIGQAQQYNYQISHSSSKIISSILTLSKNNPGVPAFPTGQ